MGWGPVLCRVLGTEETAESDQMWVCPRGRDSWWKEMYKQADHQRRGNSIEPVLSKKSQVMCKSEWGSPLDCQDPVGEVAWGLMTWATRVQI